MRWVTEEVWICDQDKHNKSKGANISENKSIIKTRNGYRLNKPSKRNF